MSKTPSKSAAKRLKKALEASQAKNQTAQEAATTNTTTTTTEAPHIPVMLAEVLSTLAPKDNETYIDGTFGYGGYTSAILDSASCRVFGFDRDPSAMINAHEMAKEFQDRLIPVHSDFGDMLAQMQAKDTPLVDAIILDLGVSSMQLDQAARGFSFQRDGALDMRMDDSENSPCETVASLIARLDEDDLADILYLYGDERKSRRIARAIKQAQIETPITTTLQLAGIIAKANPQSPKIKTHPATKSFQALRIAVNDELGQLKQAMAASLTLLNEGGRLIIVTFHSLEDRLVKRFLKRYSGQISSSSRHLPDSGLIDTSGPSAHFTLPHKKPFDPQDAEIAVNPRARSARLRYAVRTDIPFTDQEVSFDG